LRALAFRQPSEHTIFLKPMGRSGLKDVIAHGLSACADSSYEKRAGYAAGIVMQNKIKAGEENAGATKPLPAVARAHARPAHFAMAAATDITAPRIEVEVVREAPKAHAAHQKISPIGGWTKRAFDIVVSACAIVALAPLLALIALAVRIDSPGQAIFRQERGGLNGRTFRIWKFRTMRVTENRGVVQARHHDARITRLGAFLRRSSWDELPQLFNVLLGDMSIIGPRPHALEHDVLFEKIDARYPGRFTARPGITGLAQVSGCRGPTETEDKVRARTGHDVDYVRRWSWASDVRILMATVALLFWKHDPGAL
jgi:putative colanic acid biosysnthesis UDP-glucose lipid carrier transferase